MKRLLIAACLAAVAFAAKRPADLEPDERARYQQLRADRMTAVASAQARADEMRAAEDAVLAAQARLAHAQKAFEGARTAAERAGAALDELIRDLAGESGCTLTPAAEWDCPDQGEEKGGVRAKQ